LTLDESWFYLSTDHEIIGLGEGEAPPERKKYMIQARKMMITMVWNSLGFHIVNAFPKAQTFNASYSIEHILQSVLELRPESDERHLILHADNVRLHTARKSQMFCDANSLRRVPHSPYSPDLVFSDFFFRLYEVLPERIFLQLGKGAPSRNSRCFERTIIGYLAGCI
jgi:hypothetical protein